MSSILSAKMKLIKKILRGLSILVIMIILGVIIYSMPATLSLSSGIRPGIAPLTITEAVDQLHKCNLRGWELVDTARIMVIIRMQYCRRNSFDHYKKAFERGYGYCQQQAFALHFILSQLGFDSKVVHAFRNQFDDGHVGGHAWVQVTYNGIMKNVDPTFKDATLDSKPFKSLSEVKEYTPLFRYFSGWGSCAVNAHRYYMTGNDY